MVDSQTNAIIPHSTRLCGITLTTFTASFTSLVLYVLSAILILATSCPFRSQVIYFFVFLIIAVVAVATLGGMNMMYDRYRFNCLSLAVSLLHSGSVALIFYGLAISAVDGLCAPVDTPKGSIFLSKHIGNFFIWFITMIGLIFQLIAHYLYG